MSEESLDARKTQMSQSRTRVEEFHNALQNTLVKEPANKLLNVMETHLQSELRTVAQMYPLQATCARVQMLQSSVAFCVLTHFRIGLCKLIHRRIRDVVALDQPNPLDLGEYGKACNRFIGQMHAAAKVDVANPVAVLD